MNFPLISEYIEAIKSAEDNFEELSCLRPVMGDDGLPVMTSGNFAVVFKMKDVRDGKLYAVKCFTKEQEGRAEAYRQITEELKDVTSPYLTSVRYLDKELFVDTDQTNETEFPVLLMDWVEGKTLDNYIRSSIEVSHTDSYMDIHFILSSIVFDFYNLGKWLMSQPFAHGDLKMDNILVSEDRTLVLVDYDGMYVPAMKGQKAREFGSPDFRHPLRADADFDEHIDDFSILAILLSLDIISKHFEELNDCITSSCFLFSKNDYSNLMESKIFKRFFPSDDEDVNTLFCILSNCCNTKFSFSLPQIKPFNYKGEMIKGIDELTQWYTSSDELSEINLSAEDLINLDDLMCANRIKYVIVGTMGLYLHGLIPDNYSVNNINILVFSNSNSDYERICNCLSLVENECYNNYELYGYGDSFLPEGADYAIRLIDNVYVSIKIVKHAIDSSKFHTFSIRGRSICVLNVYEILEQKYRKRRKKDYEFYIGIQNKLSKSLEVDYGRESEIAPF